MLKIEPYEHKGNRIKSLEILSTSDALKIYELYKIENDIWIKKLYATRLLESKYHIDLKISLEILLNSIQCQIEL